MTDFLGIAAATLPVWRDSVVAALAGIVIGAIWLYVSLVDPS